MTCDCLRDLSPLLTFKVFAVVLLITVTIQPLQPIQVHPVVVDRTIDYCLLIEVCVFFHTFAIGYVQPLDMLYVRLRHGKTSRNSSYSRAVASLGLAQYSVLNLLGFYARQLYRQVLLSVY